jgi:hypothetical protein
VVVNLDGWVNDTIYEYYRRREFDLYLRRAGIRCVADEGEALGRAMRFAGRPVPLEVVATAPLTGWISGKRCIWQVAER